jgi:hypothetical protein
MNRNERDIKRNEEINGFAIFEPHSANWWSIPTQNSSNHHNGHSLQVSIVIGAQILLRTVDLTRPRTQIVLLGQKLFNKDRSQSPNTGPPPPILAPMDHNKPTIRKTRQGGREVPLSIHHCSHIFTSVGPPTYPNVCARTSENNEKNVEKSWKYLKKIAIAFEHQIARHESRLRWLHGPTGHQYPPHECSWSSK